MRSSEGRGRHLMANYLQRVLSISLLLRTLVDARNLQSSCASLTCQRQDNDSLATCRHELHLGEPGQYVHYYSSVGPLNGSAEYSDVTSLVVIVHGLAADADTYFETISSIVAKAGACSSAVLAPEWRAESNDSELLVWPKGSFLRGRAASNNPTVYSFAVLDSLMSLAQSSSPNLGSVTFVGHSAGSQSLQRYAGANKLSIPAKYILANAGTYMYLTDQRVSTRVLPSLNKTCPSPPGTAMCPLTAADFSQPWDGAASCNGYNDGKYGLGNLAGTYMARAGAATILKTYLSRRITYLLGNDDTLDNAHLDKTCAARAQGADRKQRGLVFYQYLKLNAPNITSLQQAVIVPNCGHNESCIFSSAQFLRAWGFAS